MKHTWKVALAVAVLAGSAGVAKADLTLEGQTGLFLNPTAEIAKKGAPEISVSYVRNTDDGYKEKEYGIYGAIQAADRLELSAGYHHYMNDTYDYSGNTWHIGGKYQILNQKDKGFDLAAGADYGRYNESGDSYSENYYLLYLAATKSFQTSSDRAPIQGTVGLRWDKSTYNDGYPSDSKASVYAGVQVPVTRTGEVSLIGELGSKQYDGGESIYAIGVRYHPKNTGLSLGVGYGRPWGYGHALFAQVGYAFGK